MSVKILIVDDSARLRSLLKSCIEENPRWKVCGEAENGKVALEKVNALSPDLVILDWLMPVMSGLEAARQIARIAPKTAMVMLTLHVSDQLLKEARAVGIEHVISKTERLGSLVGSLTRALPELEV